MTQTSLQTFGSFTRDDAILPASRIGLCGDTRPPVIGRVPPGDETAGIGSRRLSRFERRLVAMVLERPHLLHAGGTGTALAEYLDELIAAYRAELIGRIERLNERIGPRLAEAGADRDAEAGLGRRGARIWRKSKQPSNGRSRRASRLSQRSPVKRVAASCC